MPASAGRHAAGRQLPRLLRAGPDPVHGQHRGIFWVEVGVAITVCGVMLKIFYMFAARGDDGPPDVDERDERDGRFSHFGYFVTVFLMMPGCSSSSRAAT
jgi:hypothetical protein